MKKYQMPLVEVALLSSSMDQMQTGGGSPGGDSNPTQPGSPGDPGGSFAAPRRHL